MNVEKLYRILIELDNDLTKNNYLNLIQQVQTHLQNQVNQPNQPTHQTNLVNSLKGLYNKLEQSDYNRYSPGWKQVILEISGENLLGVELKEKIETIFSQNKITPAKALEEIKKIYTNFQAFQQAIKNTLNGFKVLNIEAEELKPGECEFGYLIPRKFIENKLSYLRDEMAELNFILNHIAEAVSGEKEEFKVKTISSSDFLLYVIIGLSVAEYLSRAIERILNIYKQILEIKILRNQLSDKGVPKKETSGIEKFANGIMKTEIDKITIEIINNYPGEEGRKNELKNGVRIALNKLANRIDNGFKVEIRVEPLPEPEDENNIEKTLKEKIDLVEKIKESSKNIDYLETGGKAILKLPEDNN